MLCTDPERRGHLSRAVASLVQKMSPRSSMKGLVSGLHAQVGNESKRRDVGSVSPHQSPINIRQAMPPRAKGRKQQPLITKLIDSLMRGQSKSEDSIVGLVAKAAATTGGGSRSEDFSPTALTTADQHGFSFATVPDCYPVAMKRSIPLCGWVFFLSCVSFVCR